MNRYELVVMIDAHLTQEEKEAIIKQIQEPIGKNGGKVVNIRVWVEKHKTTFRIKRKDEFTYYLIEFDAPASAAAPLRSALRLNEGVLRFLITKREKVAV